MDERNYDAIRRKCEQLGIDKVRHNLASGIFAGQNAKVALAWLAEKDREAAAIAAASHEAAARSHATAAREQAEAARAQAAASVEANRLASEANDIAREAKDKAHTANILATIALIVAIMSAAVMAILQVAFRD